MPPRDKSAASAADEILPLSPQLSALIQRRLGAVQAAQTDLSTALEAIITDRGFDPAEWNVNVGSVADNILVLQSKGGSNAG